MLVLHHLLTRHSSLPKPPHSTLLSLSGDLIGILITILQLAQFVPQHIECYRDKSVVGVSSWLLFFGGLYTYLAAVDLAITDLGPVLRCNTGLWSCFITWQPMLQMIGAALLCGSLWWWYVLYHHNVDLDDEEERKLRKSFFYGIDGIHFFILFILIGGVVGVGGAAIVLALGAKSSLAVNYAHWCGITAAIINTVMWIPQIVTTYTYKHKGALSEYWVLFSVIMDVVYTLYLIYIGLDISIWLNNVPDGIQTAVLFCMIMYYEKRDRQFGLDDFGHRMSLKELRENGERKGLLAQNGAEEPRKSYSEAVQGTEPV